MKRIISALCLFVVLAFESAFAVVADPTPRNVKQSDGTTLTVVLQGDERVAWARTLDLYTLMRDKNDDYVYAVDDGNGGIKPSTFIAHNEGERSVLELEFLAKISKKLFYSPQQVKMMKQYWAAVEDSRNKALLYNEMDTSVVNEYKILVVLMSYGNLEFSTPKSEVEDLFNQVGYTKNGHQGSVHDYFLASTFGKLNVQATVIGPYTASNDMEYYGENYEGTHSDMHARDLMREAAQYADDELDLSQFANASGSIPCMYVIYAGYAESSGNSSYTIWPHQGMIYPPYLGDGVNVSTYSCSSEYSGYQGSQNPLVIGTICHEFSHALGQPDFYDTNYEIDGSCFVPDSWDIMSSGNYNNNGKCPPLWSAMERTVGGYIQIQEIHEAGTYTLPALYSGNKAYKLSIGNTGEYFLLENRQKVGWDKFVPGHGMMIYRVNPNVNGWYSNSFNTVAGSEGYLVISADNQQYISAANPFPGTMNKTSFTNTTSPSAQSSDGVMMNKPIYDIKENTQTESITFSLMDTTTYLRINNTNITFSQDTINMSASIVGSLSVSAKGFCYSTSHEPTIANDVITSTAGANNISAKFTDYLPATDYYIRAYATASNGTTNYGETFHIKTPCDDISVFPYLCGFEDEDATLSCWSQSSNDYVSNMWQSVSQSIPNSVQGPASGERFAYIHNDYQYANQATMLISPTLNTSVLSQPKLVFSHHQKYNGNNRDNLVVYYRASPSSSWTQLKAYNNTNISQWKSDTVTLPVKSKTLQIGFETNLKGGYGIGIDDFEIIESNINAFPSVQTTGIEDISDATAVASINVLSAGFTPMEEVGVVLSQNPAPTYNDIVFSAQGNSLGSHTIELSNLESSTTYYLRAFARNAGLISYGTEISFTTLCSRVENYPYQPVLNSSDTTCFVNNGGWYTEDNTYAFSSSQNNYQSMLILPILDLANRDNMSIEFSYKQNSNPVPFKVLFRAGASGQWEELASYTSGSSNYQTQQVAISTTPTHQSEQAYIAFEAQGGSQGKLNIKDITINAVLQLPLVTTSNVELSAYNEFTAQGEVTYSGLSAVTSRGFCYSKTNNQPTINDQVINAGSGMGTFTQSKSNLELLTTYYVRAFATNSYGTAYGETKQITTLFYPINNNIISDNQSICENTLPQRIQGAEPTGGNGEFEYLWIKSEDSITWRACDEGSLNNFQWYDPRMIHQTTYYARVVTSGATIDTSNVVEVFVSTASRGGNVFYMGDTVPNMYDIIHFQLRAHNGDVQYWEYKKPYYDWQIEENSEGLVDLYTQPNSEGVWVYRAVVKNGQCNSAISGSDSTFVKYVGLEDIKSGEAKFILTPNPSDGMISIQSQDINSQPAVLTISTTSGQQIQQRNLVLDLGDNFLNLSNLPSGTYIINIKTDDINWTGKLLITK